MLIGTSLGISKTSGKEYLPVLHAVCGAIARHHTSQASKYGTAHLNAAALRAAEEALLIAHQEKTWSFDASLLNPSINKDGDLAPVEAYTPRVTHPEQGRELETWLYFVIVRALRLADQRAG